jgi:hypothetical protein
MSKLGDLIKERVNKVLPKVFESAEEKLGYELPIVKITEIDTYSTGKLDSNGEYKVSISGVFVDAIISKKDGTFGKVKKLVLSTIENVITVSGYEYREVYVTYKKDETTDFINETTKDKGSEKYLEIIKHTLKGDRDFTGKYLMPYSDNDDDYVDFIINYHIDKVSLWKSNGKHCQYEGVVYVKIDKIIVGFEGTNDWEDVRRIQYLPSWVEDEFKDSIQNELDIYDNICMDIDYN